MSYYDRWHYSAVIIMKDIDTISDANNLITAFKAAQKGTIWKESVQKYEIDLLTNIRKSQLEIQNGTYKPKDMVEFEIHERGHTRDIKSHHISDRVIQHSWNDNILIPRITPKLIYDNGASQKGKGLSHSRKRFENAIHNAYREYGPSAYIMLIDFSKYFDNILHRELLRQFSTVLDDTGLEFARKVIEEFEIDVSYMTDEEFALAEDALFNSLEYKKDVTESMRTGEKRLRKSVGIGNQTSQIAGVFYPHRIDNYCKIVKCVKYYGRYMDDTYIISNSKDELVELYGDIKAQCVDIGIHINEKKTTIRKITEPVTYLKINYKVLPSGRLIRKVHNSVFRREYRRIKKFKRLSDKGDMSLEDAIQCFKSWKGTFKKYDSGYKMLRIERYFRSTFKITNNTLTHPHHAR